MPNVRTDPQAAEAAFRSMPDSEWEGLCLSLARGGALERPVEHEAFQKVARDRGIPLTAAREYLDRTKGDLLPALEEIAAQPLDVEQANQSLRDGLEEVEPEPDDVLVPWTGELVDLGDLPAVAALHKRLTEWQQDLSRVRTVLNRTIHAEAMRQGTKTPEIDGEKWEITGGPRVEWNQEVLAELIDAGMPQETFDKLVKTKVEFKVDGNVLRQIRGAGNEAYTDIIERAREERPGEFYARPK